LSHRPPVSNVAAMQHLRFVLVVLVFCLAGYGSFFAMGRSSFYCTHSSSYFDTAPCFQAEVHGRQVDTLVVIGVQCGHPIPLAGRKFDQIIDDRSSHDRIFFRPDVLAVFVHPAAEQFLDRMLGIQEVFGPAFPVDFDGQECLPAGTGVERQSSVGGPTAGDDRHDRPVAVAKDTGERGFVD